MNVLETWNATNVGALIVNRKTLAEARVAIADARKLLASDAPLQQDMRASLQELGRAAQALRHLADTEGIDTSRAVMIGDRSHDIRAARMNGARAVGVAWGYGSHEELAAADAIVAAPADLPQVLRGLASG